MDILTSIASKVAELLVEPAGRQLGYLICSDGNIKALTEETEKLKDKRAAIQMSMDKATTQLEVISPEVKRWVSEVDKIMNELRKFFEEDVKVNKTCFNGWCQNLKLRHSLGRKAKKHTEVVLKLQQEGKFDRISYPAPPTGMHLVASMKAFDSRTKILKQVMEAVRDENIHIIAICGMGGIGKTTMAKEVARSAQEEKLFGAAVMAVVSQNPNVTKIQGEIADALHFKFSTETELGRANELRRKIQETEKILIVLDDIWERLDLEAVGIPSESEHQRCKILLTSRNEEVARIQMRSQKTFIVQVLSENEAWNLFEEVAGPSINNHDLRPIAEQIANECKGLPVAIVTVGRALEEKGKEEWNDALFQLRKSIARNISAEVGANVFSSIELSYTFLRSEEAKSCFLLCCLFPEDHDIPIETLVRYGKGLRLFENTDAMEEARNRVHTLVQTLKRCFLLLDSNKRGCVKLHDVVRDVAISIASKEHGFVVICSNEIEEWPEIDTWENCTTISVVTNKIKKHLNRLVCPKLKLLHLSTKLLHQQEFNDNFFRGMENLEVLTFQKVDIQSLPSPLQVLRNMRTLRLENCVLKDISSIGALVKLEILSLFGSIIQELPREIGHLQHLKLLDITECKQLDRIPPGALSSLTKLEELYMYRSFSKWSHVQGNEEKMCASVDELISLSDHLKNLDIWIPQVHLLGRSSVLFNKLTRFRIVISDYDRVWDSFTTKEGLFENYLRFEGGDTKSMIECEIHLLLNKCETLKLSGVNSLKNVTQLNEDGFSKLKVLTIKNCRDVEYLINLTSKCSHQAAPLAFLEKLKIKDMVNLEGLCHPDLLHLQRDPKTRFQLFYNLTNLILHSCCELQYVFSTSIARGSIPQLQYMHLCDCRGIEGVIYKETEESDDSNIVAADMIVFPKLASVEFLVLPSLISLYRSTTGSNQLDWTLKNICFNGKLVPFNYINWLPSLQSLRVAYCSKLGVVFDFDGLILGLRPEKGKTNTTQLLAAQLIGQEEDHLHGNDNRYQCLGCLRVPTSIRKHKPDQGNVKTVQRSSHPDPQVEVRSAVARDDGVVLHHLETVFVGFCSSVGVIFDFGGGQGPFPPVLNNLNELALNYLPELLHIWNITKKGVHQLAVTNGFQNLREIRVHDCGRLRCIFSPSIAKLLVMLESISVRYCKSMQAVIDVAKEGEEEEEEKQEENAIAFPHLRKIDLRTLGNLSCFCHQPNYAFVFPSLQSISIEDCPKFATFVRAATMSAKDTPMLEQVEVDGKEIFDHKGPGDLNTTIHQNFQLKQEKPREREKLRQEGEGSSKNSTPSVRSAANQPKSGFPPKTLLKTSSSFSSRLEAGMVVSFANNTILERSHVDALVIIKCPVEQQDQVKYKCKSDIVCALKRRENSFKSDLWNAVEQLMLLTVRVAIVDN
ncbi:hypothetical protein FNV43_RR20999 [Rhamnella rubrinervis]|uniref:AAA+ ATPase domain-containing protein n=1 Tax=Rhamnella rubrinervis TaxID=2594499 RepID=A0A8K0GV26_9ROSA|nr:hypothetical protein FNV43_RR20999 [Rhamnella rubrinervis]